MSRMNSRARSLTAVLAGAAALVFFAAGAVSEAVADPAPKGSDKQPSASRQLKEAYKKLVRLKSYRVSVDIDGGISDNKEHRITLRTVRESYTGDTYSRVMHIPDMKAYRTLKKGVRYVDGSWRNILADRPGAICDRLFAFPEVIVTRALRYARGAQWMEDDAAPPPSKGATVDADPEPEADEEASDAPGGKTVVRSGEEADGGDGTPPRFIRVEAPVKEALAHVLEVQNSGCLSGG